MVRVRRRDVQMKREFSLAEGKIWSDSLLWENIEVSFRYPKYHLPIPRQCSYSCLSEQTDFLSFSSMQFFKMAILEIFFSLCNALSFSFFVKQTLGISPVLFTLMQIGIKMWPGAEADQSVTNCLRNLGICSQLILTLSCSFCRERSIVTLLCIYLKEQILTFNNPPCYLPTKCVII